jgi:S1-C subfamily serine protease
MHSTRTGLALLAALAISGSIPALAQKKSPEPPPGRTMSKLQAATSLAPMLERVMPGVVSILITGERERPITIGVSSGPGGAAAVPETPVKEPFRSGGSGVIVDAGKGIIITNHHVIADASRIDIALSDGRVTEAKLLGTDAATDIAVLKIELKDLKAVPYGDSDRLRVGDFIAAVGNPFGLEGSASQGIVSALMRTDIGYEIFEDFIQVDAAVNPGNSGGALVDIDGRLVGINTATGSAKMRTQGIAFAVPVNMARAIAGELIEKGTFKRGATGAFTEDLNFSMAQEMSLPITRGAAIKSVVPGSPAALAGVKKGDVVTGIGGKLVRGRSDYVARVSTTPIGRSLKLELVSAGGVKREVTVKVTDLQVDPQPETPPMALTSLGGLSLGAMLPGFKSYGVVQGARVLSVGSGPISTTGLKPDDVITKVDNSTVRSPQDVYDSVSSKMGKYRLEVHRDSKKVWIWVDGA